MSNSAEIFVFGGILGVVIGVTLSMVIGLTVGDSDAADLRREAVEHGAARWDSDSRGHTTFHWNDAKKPEAEKLE